MVGLGTSKRNAECYWKVLERIKTTEQRVTLTKRKQKAYADTDDEGVEIHRLVTEHALSANRRSNWVVHSGATCHMCNNQKLFDQIIGLETPQETTVGDGHSVQATSRGDVILRLNVPNRKIQKCKLSDVLYVPDLSHNLLSVSKAANNGKSFEV